MIPIASLTQVTKSFGTQVVLRGVDMEIQRGEFIMLTGESGSGKSTLLSILAGLDTADAGQVVVNGIELDGKISQRELSCYRVLSTTMIYQDFHLLPVLNVWDNILLPARLHLNPSQLAAATEYARKLSHKFGLDKVLKSLPETLSGGEKQRTAIVRALLTRPVLLLADEPTGNLDSRNAALVTGILSDLHKEGQTILMVTHSPEISRLGSRRIVMKDGRLTAEST